MSACDVLRENLVDVARGAPCENALREHLESCSECRRRLANERMLSTGLAAICLQAVPPAAVRNAVMAEFRRANSIVPIRRPVIKWVAMAAAAAVILLTVWLGMKPAPRKVVATVTPPVQGALPVHAPVAATAATPKVSRPVKRRRAVKVQTPPAETTPEVATDFFELPYSEPLRPEERVDVLRIQMPRANMAVFGLPLTGGRLDSSVTADVLIGEDGVMRAVRFIH